MLLELVDPRTIQAISSSLGKDDFGALQKFLEESRWEIEDVYRGIIPERCGNSDRNYWGKCVNESSCTTQTERTIESLRLGQVKKKKKNKTSSRRRKPEICKCNFNPQCLLSLDGAMNSVLARNKTDKDSNGSKYVLPEVMVSSSNGESKSSSILSHLRKSISIPKAHLINFFESLSFAPVYTFSKYIQQVTNYHSSLLLPSVHSNIKIDYIQLSQPPGMINLGATCYLNSQIQCLTQNIAFQRGVLSWRNKSNKKNSTSSPQNSPEPEVGINAALLNLQVLLAKLQHTPFNTIDTTNFASSLNLLESEMQDPNEFSRLLLDRMMDLCPALKKLLKEIFEGKICYRTVCSYCGNARKRKETFMELTLPIPERQTQTKKENSSSSKNKNQAVSVTECLQEYLKIEELHSENQYYCETCRKKRDAQRSVSFVNIPPVLQIQLSRYVFDIQRNVKRKRMDEAKLPLVLDVHGREYLLCGVLHHMGPSAYGGHYIAEGMDWTTGVWFEFNDKEVKILEEGPTGGEEELFKAKKNGKDDRTTNGKRKIKKGSEDAYSMFYVEKKYLSETVQRELELRTDHEMENEDVTENAMDERKKEYEKINKIQGEFFTHQAKMVERHQRVLTQMFTPSTPLHLQPSNRNLVWVDGFQLRNFLSCPAYRQPELHGGDNQKSSFLTSRELLCSHNESGLNPRIARRGKLLTKQMYDAYQSILEHEGYIKTRDDSSRIDLSSNVWCELCAKSYQQEIRDKYNMLITLLDLFGALESSLPPNKIEENVTQKKDSHVNYYVSSKFASDVKRYSLKKMKEIIKDKSIQEEGIDKLSLNEIINSESVVKSGGGAMMDPFVNTRVTCPHGNLKHINGRVVKKVHQVVWSKIKVLFPKAIPHICKDDVDGDKGNEQCLQCEKEYKCIEVLKSWAQKAMSDKCLKLLMKGKLWGFNENCRTQTTTVKYLVNGNILEALKEAVEFYCGKVNTIEEDLKIFSLLAQAKKLESTGLISDDDMDSLKTERSQSEKFFHVCEIHKKTLPIPPIMLKEFSKTTMRGNSQEQKKKPVEQNYKCDLKVLNETEYNCLHSCLSSFPHERVLQKESETDETSVSRLYSTKVIFSTSKQVNFTLHPAVCPDCSCSCVEDLPRIEVMDKEVSEVPNGNMKSQDYYKGPKSNKNSSEDRHNEVSNNDVIMIEDSRSDMVIPVYQIDDNADVYAAAETEAGIAIASHGDKTEEPYISEWVEGNVVRRSNRKRKARFQTYFTVKMKRDDRLAKLRLLLFERHNKSPLNQQLFLTVLYKIGISTTESKKEHTVSELETSLDEQTFDSILGKETTEKGSNFVFLSFWLYLKYTDSDKRMSKKEKTEIENSILDSLLISDEQYLSSTTEESKKTVGKRGTEIGFNGTLLQSNVGSSKKNPIIEKEADVSADKKDNSKVTSLRDVDIPEQKILTMGNIQTPISQDNGTKKMPIAIDM